MKGYKATDKDMKCRGFQFELGVWHETKEKMEFCKSGFHFCKYPSGVHYYYDTGARVFEVEAENVLTLPEIPGADFKLVCSRIKLIKEIFPTGYRNTGHGNTGDRNTGDCNTGHNNAGHGNAGHDNAGDNNTGHGNTGCRNAGHNNTGYRNTGDNNTGDGNAGDCNAGHNNAGDNNTGHGNTGCRNAGHNNTGHRNTGCRNTGDDNAGDGNTGHGNTGYFCQKSPKILCFDIETRLTRKDFEAMYPEHKYLSENLLSSDLNWDTIKNLPGISKRKLKSLITKHKEKRNVLPK